MSRFDRFRKSSNPFLNERRLADAAQQSTLDEGMVSRGVTDPMTVSGAVNKTLILAALMLLTATIGYANPSPLYVWGGAIGGLILVVVMSFNQKLSPTLAPIYALLEGLFVGSITAIYAGAFSGIAIQAILLTVAILFMMLFIYKAGIIKVTQKFRSGVIMATGAILLVYILSWVLGMFGINIPYLHEGGMIGIGISVVIIGVASLNLLLDFDNFERGERFRAPKYMEWYSAVGLLVTLVWLYLEILRLLAILSSE
ncbi:MAG: Bax inhibitor-1/YccA family protein [Bacteroidota bacterium]